jgi:hypothetical protein
LNRYYLKFVPNIIISDLIFPCVATYPTQHPHFSYTYFLNVLSFCSPTFCVIHHRGSNRRLVELPFWFVWDLLITENIICLSLFHPYGFYSMINIFIDLSIILQYRSQILKCVIHGYHSSIQTNIFIIWFFSLNKHLIYSILVLLGPNPFDYKVYLHNSNFWSTTMQLSSINITSSAKSIHQGIYPCMSFVIASITKVKIYMLNVDS